MIKNVEAKGYGSALVYIGIFFTSLSSILFEISLTKIFSVIIWYHFAYFVVSLALFGLGAGGLAAFLIQEHIKRFFNRILAFSGIFQFLSMILCLLFILNTDIRLHFTASSILKFIFTYLVCTLPFFFAGLAISAAIRNRAEKAPKLYFFDLLGSAIGCIFFIPAITFFSGPHVALIAASFAMAAAICFSAHPARSILIAAVLLIAGAVISPINNIGMTKLFSVKYTKTYAERGDILFEKWSPLARITVYPTVFFANAPDRPFGWGMSKKYKPESRIKQLWIEQDACAGTPITNFDGDLSKVEYLKYDITSLPYHIKPAFSVFIIGVGGGRDVLTALLFGSSHVSGCDINPIIVNLVKERYRDFAGDLYGLPRVNVEVAEARNHIRSAKERFDIIQISLIDSWAATAAGAFSLSENSLYTVEAFIDYFKHLNENGMLSVTRFLFTPRNQSLRVVIVARKALETMGIKDPKNNIAVIGTSKENGVATILAKRTPFSRSEINDILNIVELYGFEALYLPGHDNDVAFSEALNLPLIEVVNKSYFDLRPTTDDRPFFFQMIYFSRSLDLLFKKSISGQSFNYYAQLAILVLASISSVFIGIFYITPLMVSRKVSFLPKSWCLYFILIGFGFMLVEIPLLQKGSLYLGNPSYSLSVVLFSMLIFAGIGSYRSGKIDTSSISRPLHIHLLLAGLLIGLVTCCLEWIVPNTLGYPLAIKIAIIVSAIGLPSFYMGTAFPSGIRLLSRCSDSAIPWVWALNGGASVLGAIIAMALSMAIGYRVALLSGAAIYISAALVMRYLIPRIKDIEMKR